MSVQAVSQSWYPLHTSPRPPPHCLSGTFQSARLRRNPWFFALYVSQKLTSVLTMMSHALRLAGASPNQVATCACTAGVSIQFIHLYMQLGCAAWDAIIHVSDHPVDPSLGTIAFTGVGFLSPRSRLVMTCHVVPTTVSPLANAACVFV